MSEATHEAKPRLSPRIRLDLDDLCGRDCLPNLGV